MAEADVELYAEQVVQNQHEPPRRLHLHVLLGVVFDRGSIWVMLFGLATILAGFGYLIMPVDDPSGRGLGVIVAFISGGLIAISPWIYMWKWYRALRYGRLASATIIELHKEGPGSQATFRAARNGAAKGRWSITTERPSVGRRSLGRHAGASAGASTQAKSNDAGRAIAMDCPLPLGQQCNYLPLWRPSWEYRFLDREYLVGLYAS
jgi:hypothetical protein